MIHRRDIPDREVIDACNKFWEVMRSRERKWPSDYDDVHEFVPLDVLSRKYPPKVVLRKMEQLVDKGILEYVQLG